MFKNTRLITYGNSSTTFDNTAKNTMSTTTLTTIVSRIHCYNYGLTLISLLLPSVTESFFVINISEKLLLNNLIGTWNKRSINIIQNDSILHGKNSGAKLDY